MIGGRSFFCFLQIRYFILISHFSKKYSFLKNRGFQQKLIVFNEKDNFVGTAQCPKKHAKKRSHKIVIKENFGS